VKLEATGEGLTTVRMCELTPTEEHAVRLLRQRALKKSALSTPWIEDEKAFPDVRERRSAYRTKDGVTVQLSAPIAKVQAVLAKALKPNRKLVTAVTFADGRMEEVRATASAIITVPEKATKAVTVAAPTVGCPVPEFPESEVRATRVLEAFLSSQQLKDYRTRGAFIARGADTGHQYAITHRERRAAMNGVSSRSLYDLTDARPLCVHDWTVPPPEEMLALFVCISLPGNERRVRDLPEALL